MLRISKLTDYAVVVLAHLARHAHVCVHSASDIASATSIPQPTVAKVLKMLARDGLVQSSRGAHGGYSLGRDPRRITIACVIDSIEGPIGLTACSQTGPASGEGCADEHHCQLSIHWPGINAAVRSALEAISIDALARPEPAASGDVALRAMPTPVVSGK
ncbi:MAG: SUF system Fe-S cluster assembly regulator [Alphaproteobacteria bacterium]|nr:SUF system Fe-S cluster assembly regulator [Alphaproteobacteria bacterium]